VRLCGREGTRPALTGPAGSLRRAAQEAQIKHEKAIKDRALRQAQGRIDFGCAFPFTDIPSVVQSGFNQAKTIFSGKGDIKVLDHYQLAMNCLAENIDDPLCCLMLMITLTVCSSSETPEVAQGSRELFPWAKNSGGTAYDVGEMTKKIEHKGCSNRMLQAVGWVTSKSKRDSPRNTDLQLRSQEELLETLRGLQLAIKRPEDFIGIIFHSQDDIWVERCGSLVNRAA
ncbi:hypothetical protein BDP81DRAFT_432337, partial [Colletotrichum phormii]